MEMADLGHTAGLALRTGHPSATGCIAMNDMLAIGLLAGLRQSGLRIPQDVSVIGIDNMFLGSYLNPALSTIGQPMQQMASAAVERVLARMNHGDEAAHEQVFLPELVQRESTAHRAAVNNLENTAP
jgi:DNA-binding LacI/PurR family transcriptional regulator